MSDSNKQKTDVERGYPLPDNEEERLLALYATELLDTPPEANYDDLTIVASQVSQTPIAFISLVDRNRQWFKSKVGITVDELARSVSVCAHTITEPGDIMIVRDALEDPRFMDNPFVRALPNMRFYAGVPLLTREGLAIGTLCVMDTRPRDLDEKQVGSLKALARSVIGEIELRQYSNKLRQMYLRNTALAEIEMAINQHDELSALLNNIVEITTRLLPSTGGASIVLWDDERKGFFVSASTVSNQPSHMVTDRVRQRGGATRWIIEHKKPIIVEDIRDDPFRANPMLSEYGLNAYAGVPLISGDKAIGVMYALNKNIRAYPEEDIAFMNELAGRAALAIEKVKLFEELRALSVVDELTGIYNRRHFFELSLREFDQARRYEYPFSIIMLDIDNFKMINDTYGHSVGDQVLITYADLCLNTVRRTDILGRFGGDEFVISMPSTSLFSAIQLAERLRTKIEKTEVIIGELHIQLASSFGIATLSETTQDAKSLVDEADTAMYQAKESGGNRVKWLD